ncbi:hypothetical protein DS901_09440 [Loktanella sp. D2R18]|nr:hypothetical protein DS901_09440 [Loktanella sp. D2R18]
MNVYAKRNRFNALVGSTMFLLSQGTIGNSACIDAGTVTLGNDTRAVDLCMLDNCATAILSKVCGNIHYSSQNYEAGADLWLFRVRYHQNGNEDDEYSIILNGTKIYNTAARQLTCVHARGAEGCEFIDEVLGNKLSE